MSQRGRVIHFNGIPPAARATGESFIEAMRPRGDNAVGLGVRLWLPGRGEHHPDAILSQQSLRVDGRPVVKNGVSLGPAALARAAETLEPRTAC